MNIDIYAAVSRDGFIARENGDTDWVKDEGLFEEMCRTYGVICLGKTTFDEFGGPAVDGVQHIVLSHKPQKSTHPHTYFVTNVGEAIKKAEELGFSTLLVIGGAKTNQSFIEAGRADKLILDRHAVNLGKGLKLFGALRREVPCVVKSETPHPGFVHIECEILRP